MVVVGSSSSGIIIIIIISSSVLKRQSKFGASLLHINIFIFLSLVNYLSSDHSSMGVVVTDWSPRLSNQDRG